MRQFLHLNVWSSGTCRAPFYTSVLENSKNTNVSLCRCGGKCTFSGWKCTSNNLAVVYDFSWCIMRPKPFNFWILLRWRSVQQSQTPYNGIYGEKKGETKKTEKEGGRRKMKRRDRRWGRKTKSPRRWFLILGAYVSRVLSVCVSPVAGGDANRFGEHELSVAMAHWCP